MSQTRIKKKAVTHPKTANYETLARWMKEMWEEKMPFNAFLGIKIISFDKRSTSVMLEWKDILVGNPNHKSLHGGVIAAIMDLAGGIVTWMANVERYQGSSLEEARAVCFKAEGGTIDLRVDFVAPGRGKYFIAKADIVRFGERVVVTRMELTNDSQELIAIGTGTYFVKNRGTRTKRA